MSEQERHALVDMLARTPTSGVLVQGGGGIRKVRFAVGGKGKSGGVRVIYLYADESVPVFLLTVFAKAAQANLTKAQLGAFRDVAKRIVCAYRKGGAE